MKTITLITGNPGKLQEYRDLLPKDSHVEFKIHKLDLPEVQSLDLQEIVKDKLKKAYEIIGSPVIVEDVSAGIDDIKGLPGPFYKFFEKQLGTEALLILAKQPGEPVTVACAAGYYDGETMLLSTGELHGTLVKPRGTNGFGFDPVIIPDGEKQTMAEMTPEEKHRISHRGKAVSGLLAQL